MSREDPNYEVDKTDVYMMTWFRDHYGTAITHPFCKAFVIILLIVYLAFSIWGCFLIIHGKELNHLMPDGSRPARFYDEQEFYFGEYQRHVQLMIHSRLQHKEDFDEMRKLLRNMTDSGMFRTDKPLISWLKDYEEYAAARKIEIDYEHFFENQTFKNFLKEEAYIEYTLDAVWKVNEFRFIFWPLPTYTNKEARVQMKKIRELVRYAKETYVYSPHYILIEQYETIFANTIFNLEFSIIGVLGVSILLIPSPLGSLWITFSTGSILIGVMGFMGFWNVNLDPVSLTQLIVCVGFAVDYTFHITYSFVDSEKHVKDHRAEDALHAVGLPILQGAVSTLISIAPLATSNAYIYIAFCKVIFLVIVFATTHGLLFLPVLLSLMGPSGHDEENYMTHPMSEF